MSVIEEKRNLRRLINLEKQKISGKEIESRSSTIFHTIEQLDIFQKASVVMIYWSMDGEINTHAFIRKWFQEKTILLPVVRGNDLSVRKFTGTGSLQKEEKLGIFEPAGIEYSSKKSIDVIIVPGLAFDRENNRLGRGKAYYDKFLASVTAYKIGVCFDFQLVDKVPTDKWDIKMDLVIAN